MGNQGIVESFGDTDELEEEPEGYEHPEEEDDAGDVAEDPVPRWRKSPCPKHDGGHEPVLDQRKGAYICAHCAKTRWTGSELESIADTLLREDSNAELCRVCRDKDPQSLPYGKETGHIEWQIQKDKEGNILLDDAGDALYVGFPELICSHGHRWYKGEGPRRNINGRHPILFETHLYNRKRREIQVKEGVPDPAYTMDRWNKRPVAGMYYRCVDQETEALTPTGWKSYDEISVGDSIWIYDIGTDRCRWGSTIDMYVDDYCGWMQVLESQNISARTTAGHSWAVAHERDKSHRFMTRHLLERHYIPMPHTPEHNNVATGWAYVRPALQDSEWYEGTIWCPSTETGFWVARRNGRTYVTGNTHPLGRKVNTPDQRKRNGASYYR